MIRSCCLDREEKGRKMKTRTTVGRVQLRNPVVFGKKIKPFFLFFKSHSGSPLIHSPSLHTIQPPSVRAHFLPSCHHLKQRSSHTDPWMMKTRLIRSWEPIDDTAGYKTSLSVNTEKWKGGERPAGGRPVPPRNCAVVNGTMQPKHTKFPANCADHMTDLTRHNRVA